MTTGTVKNLLMNLMRLFTPDEIGELTTMSSGNHRISLTVLTQKKLLDTPVLEESLTPLSPNEASDEKVVGQKIASVKENFVADDKCDLSEPSPEKEGAKVMQVSTSSVDVPKTTGIFIKEEVVPVEEKVDVTVFILEEHRKSKEKQKKLKEQEVRGLYQKNAAVPIEQEKKLKNDLAKSLSTGVLVNKKQG